MKITKLLTLFLSLWAIMCVPTSTYRVYKPVHTPLAHVLLVFGKDFSLEEHIAMTKAIEMMKVSFNGNISIEVAPNDMSYLKQFRGKKLLNGRCYDIIDVKMVTAFDPSIEKSDKEMSPDSVTMGQATFINRCKYNSLIRLVTHRINGEAKMKWVFAHEVFHVLGVKHAKEIEENSNRLMYPGHNSRSLGNCIPKADMLALCEKIGCDIASTHHCMW